MKHTNKIIIGTRGSELALWQAHWVENELKTRYPSVAVELVIIKTTGDKILDSPLSKIGDKGLFTKEIEKALLDKEIDLAIHSLKDVPTQLTPGLILGAISEREDVRDVFISHPSKSYRSLNDVPQGGKIATGSLRRKCQLLQHRPDLTIIDIRGNLKTRREKLEQSDWDGMLLAKAGVTRLGWSALISEVFSPTFILPAVGQGALGIEIREGDKELKKLIQPLAHPDTMLATLGERALLRHLEGGCQIPIGTFGRIEHGKFVMDAMVGSLDGKRIVSGSILGAKERAEELGTMLAVELMKKGAKEILDEIRKSSSE
ncbi:MAG: hydroxymethylbilane synthase [Bacteroidota bacterium]